MSGESMKATQKAFDQKDQKATEADKKMTKEASDGSKSELGILKDAIAAVRKVKVEKGKEDGVKYAVKKAATEKMEDEGQKERLEAIIDTAKNASEAKKLAIMSLTRLQRDITEPLKGRWKPKSWLKIAHETWQDDSDAAGKEMRVNSVVSGIYNVEDENVGDENVGDAGRHLGEDYSRKDIRRDMRARFNSMEENQLLQVQGLKENAVSWVILRNPKTGEPTNIRLNQDSVVRMKSVDEFKSSENKNGYVYQTFKDANGVSTIFCLVEVTVGKRKVTGYVAGIHLTENK